MLRKEHFQHKIRPNLFALSPFIVFISTYIFLIIFYQNADNHLKLTSFPIFSCLAAITFSFFIFKEKISFKKKVKILISGISNLTVIYMCLIFIFSSVFSHIVTLNGGVDAAIKIANKAIPTNWLLPGIFVAIATFALTIGSSIGSIATFMPIAVGISQRFNINPALMAGIIVSGSMLGDNLSVISDTTIAAIHTTNCNPYKKFKENAILVLPAFIITLAILALINFSISELIYTEIVPPIVLQDFVKIIPYLGVLLLALIGIDVLVVLFSGSLIASAIGIFYGNFTFFDSITFFFEGFYQQKGIVSMVVLVMLIAGLSRTVEHNGGIKYLLYRFHKRTRTKVGAELSIALLTILIETFIARNTISILIAGPIAQQIGGRFKVASARIASLLDIFACTIHGILPYSSQLLLAAAMSNISSISLIPHLHYLFIIFIVTTLSIVKTKIQEDRKNYIGENHE